MLQIDNVQAALAHAYVSGASAAFGEAGQTALREVFGTVRTLFAQRPPEFIDQQLTVVMPINRAELAGTLATYGTPQTTPDPARVAAILASSAASQIIVVVTASRTYEVFSLSTSSGPEPMASDAIVYHRQDGDEYILAGTRKDIVPRLHMVAASNFADPTINSLDEALDHYEQIARDSSCQVLANVWEAGVDGPRLILVNRPESVMRDSLYDMLSKNLRRVHVTREHTTDGSRPVDLHVAWTGSPAEAIIEVKWLGLSRTQSGNLHGHQAPRAQEGADQLADYLDRKRSASAVNTRKGYLVVFDARRSKVNKSGDAITRDDALAFEHDQLSFNPDHSSARDDFMTPRRFFLRPRESSFLKAA